MNTLRKRLYWAFIGHKKQPWPEPCPELPAPEPQAPDEAGAETADVLSVPTRAASPMPLSSLRATLKLAADLLAPHFQSAISAQAVAYNGIFSDEKTPADMLTEYVAPADTEEEVDIFLSGAAWLAKSELRGPGDSLAEKSAHAERRLRRMFEVAVKDIFRP